MAARLVVVDKFECPMCPKFDNPNIRIVAEVNGQYLCVCQRCGLLFKVKHK